MAQNPDEANLPASLEAITQAVLSFINARNWNQSKQIVANHPHLLLTDEADLVFANFLAQSASKPYTYGVLPASLARAARTA